MLEQEKSGEYNGETFSFTTDIENAEKTYKHVLKTFVPYTTNYELDGKNYVINYTLDNYVRIYGEDCAREGYIIDNFYDGLTGCRIEVPVNSISGIKFDGVGITSETLSENIAIRNSQDEEVQIKNYTYIYNSNNDKRYYDNDTGKFFTVDKNYVKVYLANTEVGTALAEYKKVLVRPNLHNWEYLELYQLLNGYDNTWYYIDSNNQYVEYTSYQPSINKNADCSAINYYVENYDFNYWLVDMRFDTDVILEQKNQAIINNINNNLNLSLSNYSANSGIDYKLPELSDSDWEQALSNISMITFFQGKRIGLKTYNNYVVVTSNNNNEFVAEDSLYYITQEPYYHRYNCKAIEHGWAQGAYKNTEFKVQSHTVDDETKYYYKHTTYGNNESGEKTLVFNYTECYDCIVNRNNIELDSSTDYSIKYIALARERYIQMQRTKLTGSNGIIIPAEEPDPEPEIAVTNITLDKSGEQWIPLKDSGTAGQLEIIATVLPNNATNKTVTWTSSNPAVATVSDGIVTATGAGTTTITATAGGKSASVDICVYNAILKYPHRCNTSPSAGGRAEGYIMATSPDNAKMIIEKTDIDNWWKIIKCQNATRSAESNEYFNAVDGALENYGAW